MNSWGVIWDSRNLLLQGLLATLALTGATIVGSTVVGFLVGFGRYRRIPVLNAVLRIYIEVFRGTPLLMQLLFIYFGAAYLRWDWMSIFLASFIGLTLFQGAYISEVFRAGFESVPLGQREAATTLGLSRFNITKDVVFPQTLPVVLPPLFAQYLQLIKNTSIASVIGYAELVHEGQAATNLGANAFDVYLVLAAIYFIVSYPLSLAARGLERRIVNRRERVA